MKYKFIFEKYYDGVVPKGTYVVEDMKFETPEQAFHDALCLLDFHVYDSVRMFDETGKEYTELY